MRDQQITSADDLFNRGSAHSSQLALNIRRQESEQLYHLIDRPGELRPQILPLSGDPDRTGVLMALANHLAAQRQQWKGPKPKSICAEKSSHDDIPTGAQASVGLERHRRPEPVGSKRLVCFCHTDLPRRTGVLDADQRRSSCSAGVA